MKMPKLNVQDFCMICGRGPQMGFNRPHSQHKTKKVIRVNLDKWQGLMVCSKCRKTMAKPDRVRKVQPKLVAAV